MSDDQLESPALRLRPHHHEVDGLSKYAQGSSTRVLKKGSLINNVREGLLYASLGLAFTTAVAGAFLDDDVYKPLAIVVTALLALFTGLAALLTQARAAKNFRIGNSWAHLVAEADSLAGHLDNQELLNEDAARWFQELKTWRKRLENDEIDALEQQPARVSASAQWP